MCDFKTDSPPASVLDPKKRVRYVTGLVLGEEDFQQDQLYFMDRDEVHQRWLHGYGRVSGLGVSVRDTDSDGPEVVVAAGQAVNPRGESICVSQAQCGNLEDWLDANRDELIGSPPPAGAEDLRLWLVLCARDCETDDVPVLGDPCRTLEDATTASRIADDFELAFRLEPPEQVEEEAIRAFGRLLDVIEVTEDADDFLTPEELADLVRQIIPSGSPPEVGEPDPMLGSPPGPLQLHPDDAAAAIDAAYRVWVAEVRPSLMPESSVCGPPLDGDDGRCLLLACLDLQFTDDGTELSVVGDVSIDETKGPILLQTRLLQELLLAGLFGITDSGSASPPPGTASHSDLTDLDADDHAQYLLVDPVTRALATDLDAAGNLVLGLGEAGAPTGSEAVRWDRAVKSGDAAGGDLAGTYPDPEVAALQGSAVSNATPDTGDVLIWSGSEWTPGGVPFELDLVRITLLSWAHGGLDNLFLSHDSGGGPQTISGLALAFGREPGDSALVQAGTLDNHTVRVYVRQAGQSQVIGPVWEWLEIRPVEIGVTPIHVVNAPGGQITETRVIAPGDDLASGVLFHLDEGVAGRLRALQAELWIEVRGEHILDEDNRAIDVEFARSALPTGDRPEPARLGIQGGLFESWLRAGGLIIIDGIVINRATEDELRTLPGIGPALARRIVERRTTRGPFTRFEELGEIQGLSPAVLANLRTLLER